MKLSLILFIAYCIGLLLIAVALADAQFADTPPENNTIDIGYTGDTKTRAGSLLFVYPLKRINGYMGLYGQHAYADGEIQSEILNTRLQGGYDFGRASLEGFVATERNLLQGTAREIHLGWFVRPVTYQRRFLTISSGIGNVFTNTLARSDLGLEAGDTLNVPKWLAFTAIHVRGITTLITWTPEIRFDHHEIEIIPSANIKLRDRLSLGLKFDIDYTTDPIGDTDALHIAYSTLLRMEF